MWHRHLTETLPWNISWNLRSAKLQMRGFYRHVMGRQEQCPPPPRSVHFHSAQMEWLALGLRNAIRNAATDSEATIKCEWTTQDHTNHTNHTNHILLETERYSVNTPTCSLASCPFLRDSGLLEIAVRIFEVWFHSTTVADRSAVSLQDLQRFG
jgi:hypothetical protein